MGLGEHILDLLAGPDIPVRHILFLHGRFKFRLQSLSLTNALHNGKGQGTVHALIDQIDHNIITTADTVGNVSRSLQNQRLRIAKPYVRSVAEPRDPDQVREALGLSVKKHLDHEIRTEFRNTQ